MFRAKFAWQVCVFSNVPARNKYKWKVSKMHYFFVYATSKSNNSPVPEYFQNSIRFIKLSFIWPNKYVFNIFLFKSCIFRLVRNMLWCFLIQLFHFPFFLACVQYSSPIYWSISFSESFAIRNLKKVKVNIH